MPPDEQEIDEKDQSTDGEGVHEPSAFAHLTTQAWNMERKHQSGNEEELEDDTPASFPVGSSRDSKAKTRVLCGTGQRGLSGHSLSASTMQYLKIRTN